MRKFFYLIVALFINLNLLFADDVEFRHVVTRNDMIVGGELHLDLEMRITSGTSPRTLSSMTIDILTPSELTQEPSPGTNWAFSFLDSGTIPS